MAGQLEGKFNVRINWRGRVALATLSIASLAFRLRLNGLGKVFLNRGLDAIERRDDWFDVEGPLGLKE